MSHIKRVEEWIQDVKNRLQLASEETDYGKRLKGILRDYESLLGRLKEINEEKQKGLFTK